MTDNNAMTDSTDTRLACSDACADEAEPLVFAIEREMPELALGTLVAACWTRPRDVMKQFGYVCLGDSSWWLPASNEDVLLAMAASGLLAEETACILDTHALRAFAAGLLEWGPDVYEISCRDTIVAAVSLGHPDEEGSITEVPVGVGDTIDEVMERIRQRTLTILQDDIASRWGGAESLRTF